MAAEQPESAPIRRPGAANSPEGYPGSPEGLRGAERPTAEELAEWRAKADAATEGPWEWRRDEPASLVCEHRISGFRVRVLKAPAWGPTMADAEFIATARSAVPRLLDEVERLRETVARLTREPIGGREHAPVAAEVWEAAARMLRLADDKGSVAPAPADHDYGSVTEWANVVRDARGCYPRKLATGIHRRSKDAELKHATREQVAPVVHAAYPAIREAVLAELRAVLASEDAERVREAAEALGLTR